MPIPLFLECVFACTIYAGQCFLSLAQSAWSLECMFACTTYAGQCFLSLAQSVLICKNHKQIALSVLRACASSGLDVVFSCLFTRM